VNDPEIGRVRTLLLDKQQALNELQSKGYLGAHPDIVVLTREIEKLNSLNQQDVNDICASFQETIVKIITNKLMRAIKLYNEDNKCLVIAGGVAANKFIAANITSFCAKNGFSLHVPPLKLCTDNGAMIAWAGIERFKLGYTTPLNFVPRSRWCLEDLANL
jgi:N6-L-threonylcarbamoyladenine synthase